MKEICNKLITGFFVFVFGIMWFFTAKCYVKPNHYNVFVYDKEGIKLNSLEIRTKFTTQEVAYSYFKEYQNTHPNLKFSIELNPPKIKRRVVLRYFKGLQIM